MTWVFPGVTFFFNLALPFPDKLEEMGSHISVELDCQMDLKMSGADL